MTRKISELSISEAIDAFVGHLALRMQGVRNLDVPAANRHFLKAKAVADKLVASEPGRLAIEELLAHPILHIQVSAAEYVRRWDPDKVIPFLGRLLDADLSTIASVDERLDIRCRAKDALYMHFGIRSWDRNDLIEPLKAYGVNLTYRDHSAWQ